jgi:hypothetical protein
MAYEGEATYSALKVGSVVAGVVAVTLAIVVFSFADEPHIEFDASGSLSVSEDPDPTVVAAAVVVLGQGILLALVLWAIGTIGNHVVALRKGSVSDADGSRPAQTPPTALPEPPKANDGPTYAVVLHSLGSANPRKVRRLIQGYIGAWYELRSLSQPDIVIASHLTEAKAAALLADLEEAGASGEARETSPDD